MKVGFKSITAFGTLWGLIACHSYGLHGMRVPFPIRQMLQNLSQSISRHVERLSYAQRLHTRRLVRCCHFTAALIYSSRRLIPWSPPNTLYVLALIMICGCLSVLQTGYIVSTDGLLNLFDADCGILVVGEGAKILGLNQYSREILIMAEYLRLKKYRLDFHSVMQKISPNSEDSVVSYKHHKPSLATSPTFNYLTVLILSQDYS